MTPEAQNEAIAIECGWRRCRNDAEGNYTDDPTGPYWRNPAGHAHRSNKPPNYTGSLDAMHEAEAYATEHKITGWYWDAYWDELQSLVGCESFCRFNSCDCRDVLHATAAQKAEAFLRVLGK